ncbi:MAG: undecaprenyl-diphosphatase [Bacillus sp. (in: firmicutes)]
MDYKIFKSINQWAGRYPFVDKSMIMISQKMRYLFILLFIIMWFRNKRGRRIVLHAGIASGMAVLLEWLIKRLYAKPRPFAVHRVQLLQPAPSKQNATFPSKHTALSFVAATAVFIHKRALGGILYLLASLTGFSRIWMGQHYPSDIIGSAIIGSFTSIAANAIGWGNQR